MEKLIQFVMKDRYCTRKQAINAIDQVKYEISMAMQDYMETEDDAYYDEALSLAESFVGMNNTEFVFDLFM